jgi:hypothetical protein
MIRAPFLYLQAFFEKPWTWNVLQHKSIRQNFSTSLKKRINPMIVTQSKIESKTLPLSVKLKTIRNGSKYI